MNLKKKHQGLDLYDQIAVDNHKKGKKLKQGKFNFFIYPIQDSHTHLNVNKSSAQNNEFAQYHHKSVIS